MFNISTFKANVKPTRPNLFYAEITLPDAIFGSDKIANLRGGPTISTGNKDGQTQTKDKLQKWYSDTPLEDVEVNNRFSCRCESTELPGRTIATADDTASYGPSMKFAYDHTYADHTFTIIASDDMYERKIFEAWMDNVVNGPDLYGSASSKSGLLRYYDDYASGQVRIYQMDEQGLRLAKYTLFSAYPIALSPMNLTWEEQNTYQRFTVTMTYRYHVVNFNNSSLTI
jgi:hypothetical protein